MKKTALLFPGQGAHDRHMLEGVKSCKMYQERYQLICDVLHDDPIKNMIIDGSNYINKNSVSSLLTTLVSSLSLDLYLESENNIPNCYAGYSVGQWTALYAANCLSFESLVMVIKKRADLMDSCFNQLDGAMMSIIGVSENSVIEFIRALKQQGHHIEISNYNCPGQYSIAGKKNAIMFAYENSQSIKPKKVKILNVEGAWHSPLLHHAEKLFKEWLTHIELLAPQKPVINNVNGKYFSENINTENDQLALHLSHPVQWNKGVKQMITDDCKEFIEVGYGSVLTKFGFFIDRSVDHYSFYTSKESIF